MNLKERLSELPVKKSPYSEVLKHAFSEYEQIAEQRYLQGLADEFVGSKPKNYLLARSIVMDIHLSLEYMMNFGIAHICCIGGKNIKGLRRSINPSEVFEIIAGLRFFVKINIVDKLCIFSSSSIDILRKINSIRNAFSHGHDLSDSKYRYNGKSIFVKGTIEDAINDRKKVMADFFENFFENAKE